jgi:mevalonate kinase
MTSASAAGKIILLGEHAVVHSRPAIAVPVSAVRAYVDVEDGSDDDGIVIVAADLDRRYYLDEDSEDEHDVALQTTLRNVLAHLGYKSPPPMVVTVRSDIPIARGMGSGTAVATAIVRAVSQHLGRHLSAQVISDLVYRTEVLFHGTPSGIDNTVVAFEKPVYFVRDRERRVFWVGRPFDLVIADSGVLSRTRDAVAEVRRRWEAHRVRYERLFDDVGAAVDAAYGAITQGDVAGLGILMNRNQQLLRELGVSTPELEHLIDAARNAGALGAKLSGGGMGGCILALVGETTGATDARERVATALLVAGAQRVIPTTVR